MAKVKEIPLGRPHQIAVCRVARKELRSRPGGIVLADGVGLGKTYEALGTIASLLAQQQHGRERKQQKPHRILCLVPPGLVTKWADELLLSDRFPSYLKSWRSMSHQAVVRSFSDVVVLRRLGDLNKHTGKVRYGHHEMPGGFYIVNSNLLHRLGRKVTQIHRTKWDAIIVDEAHHLGAGLLDLHPHTLLAGRNTATLLLTATPFQLSPRDMQSLLAATYGGYVSPKDWREAETKATGLYHSPEFRSYRQALSSYFENGNTEAAKDAERLRAQVGELLRPRVIRNQKTENRLYHLVDHYGRPTKLHGSPFHYSREQLDEALRTGGIIDLDARDEQAYLEARDAILEAGSRGQRTFVATALRQLLSTWVQFRNSKSGSTAHVDLPDGPHPKTRATLELVSNVFERERREVKSEPGIGKVLIFTTYVGSEHADGVPSDEKAHGTAAALKRTLTERLIRDFPRASPKVRRSIKDRLLAILGGHSLTLTADERSSLRRALRRFAGSAAANLLLSDPARLRREGTELRKLLRNVPSIHVPETTEALKEEEQVRRFEERRARLVQQIRDRYTTRDLVARYDGASSPEERDRHLHGFNSPFAPFVLIASSVGQEGIDLQRYCRHVIHYDLEWNPAKLEQREGRVDRQGRLAQGPVNVYFMLCRGTYDERMMHAMVNRFRWHHVLLAARRKLEASPGARQETYAKPDWFRRVTLDLRPRLR